MFFGLNVYFAANIALAILINQLRLILSLSLVVHILIRHRLTIRIPKLNVEQGLLAFCLLLTLRFLRNDIQFTRRNSRILVLGKI